MGELIGGSLISFLFLKFFNWLFKKFKSDSSVSLIPSIVSGSTLIFLGNLNYTLEKALVLYGIPTVVFTLIAFRKKPSTKEISLQENEILKNEAKKEEIKESNDNSTEAELVYKLVSQRLKEAEKKGIANLADEVHKEIKYFPAWIKNDRRDYVPNFIINSQKDEIKGENSSETIKLVMDEGELSFKFRRTGSFDGTDFGELQLIWNTNSVLTMGMALTYSEYAEWNPMKIEAYIPGPWETILTRIKDEIKALEILREKNKKEDPEKIAELKKKFGL